MTDFVTKYANSAAITIGLASLASTTADPPAGRESTEVDNSSDKFLGVHLDGKITTGTSPTNGKRICLWGYAVAFDGTNYRRPSGITGADGNRTPSIGFKTAMRLLHSIDTDNTSNKEYAFTGIEFPFAFMPIRWGIFVHHDTAVALNATAGNQEIRYTGFKMTTV